MPPYGPMDWSQAETLASLETLPPFSSRDYLSLYQHQQILAQAVLGPAASIDELENLLRIVLTRLLPEHDKHMLFVRIVKFVLAQQIDLGGMFLLRKIKEAIVRDCDDLVVNILAIRQIQSICNAARYNPFETIILSQKKALHARVNPLYKHFTERLGMDPLNETIRTACISWVTAVLEHYSFRPTLDKPAKLLLEYSLGTRMFSVFDAVQAKLNFKQWSKEYKHAMLMPAVRSQCFKSIKFLCEDRGVIDEECKRGYETFDRLRVPQKRIMRGQQPTLVANKVISARTVLNTSMYLLARSVWPSTVHAGVLSIPRPIGLAKKTYSSLRFAHQCTEKDIVQFVALLRNQARLEKKSRYTSPCLPQDIWQNKIFPFLAPIDAEYDEVAAERSSRLPAEQVVKFAPMLFSTEAPGYTFNRALRIWNQLKDKDKIGNGPGKISIEPIEPVTAKSKRNKSKKAKRRMIGS